MSTRVAGHELWAEGAAFRFSATSRRPQRVSFRGVGGEGFAVCSCGATSPASLPSGAARKDWHRAHKAEVRVAQ